MNIAARATVNWPMVSDDDGKDHQLMVSSLESRDKLPALAGG